MLVDMSMVLSAALFSLVNIKVFSLLAPKIGLIDIPCERKVHQGNVPLIGGMSIYIAFSLTLLFFGYDDNSMILVLLSMAFMVFIGVLDDKYQLSVRARLIGQLLSASIIVFGLDLYLHSFGNLLFLGDINLGVFGYTITLIAILGAMNAFNMIDGIDGLLGGLSVVSFLGIFFISSIGGNTFLANLSLLIIAILIPFMLANIGGSKFFRTKIFMGDAGSMFIGLLIVWMLIVGTNNAEARSAPTFRPVFALYIVALPLMDMVAIMYRRARKGQSPFHPDRNHMHHIFMRAGFSPKQALLFLVLIAFIILLVGVGMELSKAPESIMFLVFIILFVVYSYLIQHAWKVVKFSRRVKFAKRKV